MDGVLRQLPSLVDKVTREPVAIIGVGCRFPGDVSNAETFWKAVSEGIDAITEIPADRFDVDAFYAERPATPGKIMSRWGGFLPHIDQFDAAFFGMSPREAERLDPQQRLLLEVGWEALEDAGQVVDRLAGSQTGVFVGMWLNDYEARLFANPALVDFYMTTGSGRYSASGRISYTFGFQGPSITIDTACSSSLVAVHLACQSIWSGQCSLALAGGANVILQPHITIAYSQSKMMAPDGRCKFGDARADGYVRSEGAGMVVLKPLSQAVADGDPIYAVVRGSAVNNDGRSGEYMATPAIAGQAEMLRLAYDDAGVAPHQAIYVEAHGTGTQAGDPVEIQALGSVMGIERNPDFPCAIGSVKTNLGHTEGAAGIAGLIKVALALHHRAIPPSLHLKEPNPEIPWDALPLYIPQELSPFPAGMEAAVAGVSSFGIAGTNAHVVLAEAPSPVQRLKTVADMDRPYVMPLSAHTDAALVSLAEAYKSFVSTAGAPSLADIGYTAGVRRSHHDYRFALVAASHEELVGGLNAFLQEGEESPVVLGQPEAGTARKVVFVFPGQGAQWLGMGRELLATEPVFRAALEKCETGMRPFVDWSLLEQLTIDDTDPAYRLDQIDVIQPALLAVEIALAELWQAWGVEPDAVIGHSMGEVAAAYIAGALGLEDAMRVICRRSQLLRRTSGQGAMAVVELTVEEAERTLAGYEDRLSVAVSNSPRSTVLSGEPEALEEVVSALEARDVFCRFIKVDVASHSPQMDPLKPDLLAALAGLEPRSSMVPIYSAALATVSDGSGYDAGYWVQNLRRPVLFSQMAQQLLADGHNVFIEMSPHPILLPAVQQNFQHVNQEGLVLASMRREEPERAAILNSLAALYSAGYDVDWSRLYPSGRCVSFPTYPWQRERFWYEPATPGSGRQSRPGAHPLLSQYLSPATGNHIWETELSPVNFPYLWDHHVGEAAVFPAAAVVEMVLAAVREAYGEGAHVLENVSFQEALVLPNEGGQTVQLIVTDEMAGTVSFQLFGRSEGEVPTWTQYASGSGRLGAGADVAPSQSSVGAENAAVAGEIHYQALIARGLPYGPAFQGVTRLWPQQDRVIADVQLPQAVAGDSGPYQLHPVLMDAAFQLLFATLPNAYGPETDEGATDTYLPIRVQYLWLDSDLRPGSALRGQAIRRADGDELVGDVYLYDDSGRAIMSARGLAMQRLPRTKAAGLDELLYELRWQAQPLPAQAEETLAAGQRWLIFNDNTGLGDALAAQLERDGGSCIRVTSGTDYGRATASQYTLNPGQPEHFRQLLDAIRSGSDTLQGIIHLWSLNSEFPTTDLHAAQEMGVLSVLHLVQATVAAETVQSASEAPRLWLVTREGQPVDTERINVSQSPLWGMSRVIGLEHPELKCTAVDLDDGTAAAVLLAELLSGEKETQVAFRQDQRFVARLVPLKMETVENKADRTVRVNAVHDYDLVIPTPGILDNLRLYQTERRGPGAGEVEIEVKSTGLNFIDVMKAMGIYPGLAADDPVVLGAECAGIITAIGEGVDGVAVGDAVIAITPSFEKTGLFKGYATVPAGMVVPRPGGLTFDEAATLPIAFLTAAYALDHLGRMSQGERVLIHSATGGVGLAAVQLAQRVGAEIFATAGTPEKRAYLRELGIQHVMDSRSLDFGRRVMELTNGQGVDLVLNSLTGEALRQSVAVLAPYGRFLEIGKRDIYQNSMLGLEPFKKNLSFFAIDLARVIADRPAFILSLLRELMPAFESGQLQPLPVTRFDIADTADAFRYMAQAKHIGKVIVVHERENLRVFEAKTAGALRAEGSYLLTGGLGGLGLTVARWLVASGARHLVLVGRSHPSVVAQAAVDELRAEGANIRVERADVTDKNAVARVLAQIHETMPPLRGVVHAAGILDDSTLLQMDRARFMRAMAPKVDGAWHLHTLTETADLDFFLLFSSVTALLGTPGQANYAAANAFLDALAHQRRSQGQAALSINWGPWSEVGLAAANANRGARLAERGVGSLTPAQGIAALERLVGQNGAQIAVMPFNLPQWCEFYPAAKEVPLFAELGEIAADGAGESGGADIRQRLLSARPGLPRRSMLESHIRQQVAQVLRQTPSRVPLNKPLKTLGMDSLMTLELRNRLEASLGLTLSATLIWNYPTIAALTPFLADRMEIPLEAADASEQSPAPFLADYELAAATSEVDDLSRDDVEALLADELDAIEDLLKGT